MALTAAQIASNNAAQAGYPNLAAYPGLLSAVESQESGGNLSVVNKGPSGTGTASGPFQFINNTGTSYGLTYGPGGTVFQQDQSADAAARYLSNLVGSTGSIQGAVAGYSGGSYTYAQLAANQSQYLANTSGSNLPAGQTGPTGNPGLNTFLSGGGIGTTLSTTGANGEVNPTSSTAAGWAQWAGEIGKRIGVVTLGLGIVMLALFWLFASAAIHEFKPSLV
jgi:hypothetical protein